MTGRYVPRHARRHYIGDHRKYAPWRQRHYVMALIAMLALTAIIGGLIPPS